MRKVTRETVKAFLNGERKQIGNTRTDGQGLYLHDNQIAWRTPDGDIKINMCEWGSVTTRERLNGLLNLIGSDLGISQRNHAQCLVDKNAEIIREISTNETINVTKEKKIQIAKDFVALHKDFGILGKDKITDNEFYSIYYNIIGGLYGNSEMLDDNWHEIEIGQHKSVNGITTLFEYQEV